MSSERGKRAELLGRLFALGRDGSFRTVMFHQAVADRLGLSATEMKCADVLEREGPMAAGRLAERTHLTTGAITGIIDRLEKVGLARRSPDPADRRRVIVAISSEKLAEVAPLYEPMARGYAELTATLSDAELAFLVDYHTRTNAVVARATEELRRMGATAKAEEEESIAPLGGARSGRLELATGASRVTVVAEPALEGLYRARFEGRKPRVRVQGGSVTIRHPHFGVRRSSAEIALHAGIPWTVAIHGGAARLRLELREGRVRGIEIDGGASDVVLDLPAPTGKVPVRIAGGASQVTVRRPAGVAVRLEVQGGASRLALDAQRLGAAGGEAILEAPGAERAGGRYEIAVYGGASDLVVERS